MRLLRSLSRKNSTEKSSTSDVQSRLLSSFSKINNKNIDKSRTNNLSKTSIDLFSSCEQQTIDQNQIFTNQYTSCSLSSQSAPPIQYISMTAEQSLSQKQNLIEHLKLQLQQHKYIIISLKQQIKDLTNQQQQTNSLNVQQCQKCISYDTIKQELQFLRECQTRDKQFVQMYERLVDKLKGQLQGLEQQNSFLKNYGSSIHQKTNIYSNNNESQSEFKQNKNLFNRIDLTIDIDRKENTQGSLNFDQKYNTNKKGSKQNHPSTPKNNFPLSLSKNKQSKAIDNSFTLLQNNMQNQSKLSSSPQIMNYHPQMKRKTNQSPYKLKQRFIGSNGRKSVHDVSDRFMDSQNNGFSMNMNNKLNKKIYF